jgi:glucose/arabinose dehydrogenase/PKD repeat protein
MVRRSAPLAVSIALMAATVGAPMTVTPALAATLPTGFTDSLVAAVGVPTDLAFLPDGSLFITTQSGQVRRSSGGPGTSLSLDISAKLCANSERGLLGIVLDPAYSSNRFVYLYYTRSKFGVCDTNTASAPVNRVSRFTASPNFVIDPASEVVLLDNIPSPAGNHNGGDLHVAADGLLYITVGDGGCKLGDPSRCAGQNDNARFLTNLSGKVLRVGLNGGIPASNPWSTATGSHRCGDPAGPTAGDGPCREIFAYGLRNPFRFAFVPGTSSFHINDVGQGTWEEIDQGIAGADYGWNVREGHCANGSTTDCGAPPTGMTNPIFDYSHAGGCASITGGAFVPSNTWPAPFAGAYLYADYVCGRIVRLNQSSGAWVATDFVTNLGSSSAVTLVFGPSAFGQSLYYTTYAGGGEVRRIDYSPANQKPTASFQATPQSGPAPLDVTFDGRGSTDPDGDPLTYQYTFGDGATSQGSSPLVTHRYAAAGTNSASLVVSDGRGGVSDPVSKPISVANGAPVPTIVSPGPSAQFSVGQQITLTGAATDPEQGSLPASALSWTVVLHHATHTHPFLGPVSGNNITFNGPAPEDLAAATNSYLEILLTATDANGASATISQALQPRKVNLTFGTSPSGLAITVGGATVTGPTTLTSWQGWQVTLAAQNQVFAGRTYRFQSWSDGGAQTHSITTPSSPTTYVAKFKRGGRAQ